MQRVQHSTASATLPTATFSGTVGYYTNGNPGTGTPATWLTAENLNLIQEEICTSITTSGLTLNHSAYNQLTQAIQILGCNALGSLTSYGGTYSHGICVDYVTGSGRISVGASENIQFFNGGYLTTEIARFDTTGNLCINTTFASAHLTVNGSFATAVPTQVTTSTYTVGFDEYLIIFKTAAACTVTLPPASGCPGRIIYILNKAAFAINSASANVYPTATQVLGTVIAAATAGTQVKLISDGTSWYLF